MGGWYHEGMKVLRPGYPQTNPILAGLAMVMAGGDVEEAMWQRDAMLPTPSDFMSAAWEALSWFEWPSTIGAGLASQMAQVMSQMPGALQVQSWGEPLPPLAFTAWEHAQKEAQA